ncbi:GntR family transcriptional regulator [Phytoactinopolyspora alkaliphila]|uniref:GntR family transcriptional regulator n=1 Tax=Phytoactinopolyspora alkaliphila TaxID=1783498 RepID=A0A6N9YHL8_9ACTN|nr:GntR family transcriptional regulator [Phytoactinopolyspora alkaliphila]NED94398.1 GntR family transcriptional regulator [Phytoactinopolyspora alkaliphila]
MSGTGSIKLPTFAKRTSLREQVADALRAAVVSGEMKPGQVYSAPALAARFGVSATPVREAMLDLSKQGLIETVPNKGFQVTSISDADLDQITEIRLLLEPPAASIAARRATDADVVRLRPLAQEIVESAARGDLISYVEADRAFHGQLLTIGGNRQLVDIVSELRSRTRLYGLSGLAERGLLDTTAREHLTMCDHLGRNDADALRTLMHTHIGHVRHEWAGKALAHHAVDGNSPA